MSDWSEGYVTDIGYTYGYYHELNPARLAFALNAAGFAAPKVGTACELGFGQGLSLNLHAAASDVSWYGTDFNPSQADFAASVAHAAGDLPKLYADSFAEFAMRPDLPDFDFIGLHGIWSWIDDHNRSVIVDFLHRKLKVGGVLYISYNSQPAWAPMMPVRELMSLHGAVMSAPGTGAITRVDAAMTFLDKLTQANPVYLQAYPGLAKRVEKLKDLNRSYIAHEYFNSNWYPMSFHSMSEWLSGAKLNFVGSAHLLDTVDVANLTAAQQELLTEIPDEAFRQTVRDFIVNQQFRRDYWIKGPRKLTKLEQGQALRKQRVVLSRPLGEIELKVKAGLGEVTLQEEVYQPVLEFLSDYQPKSLGQIESTLQPRGLKFPQILQAIIVLAGQMHVCSVQEDAVISKVRGRAKALNLALSEKMQDAPEIGVLASPVTGGGLGVSSMDALLLQAKLSGKKSRQEWVQHAWNSLAARGKVLYKDGAPLQSKDDNIAELNEFAQKFEELRVPLYNGLGLV